jgi:hypothetical protein
MENCTANNTTTQCVTLEINGLNYKVDTAFNEDTIDIKVKRQFSPFNFEASFTLEDLQKMEKIFYMYDTLEAAYHMIRSKLNTKKADIVEDNDSLTLKLIMEIDKNEKTISLAISKNSENNLELVVNDMSVTIQELIEKVKRLENPAYLKGSSIVKECEIGMIKSWLSEKNDIELELLYKGCIHGDTADDFHNKCDNKGPTITFIQTEAGRRFGGYTALSWDCSDTVKENDPSAFVFSLDHKRKSQISNQGYVIACYSDRHVSFGNKDFEVVSSYGGEASISKFPNAYGANDDFGEFKPNTILSGTGRFRPKCVEVFSVK